VLAHQEEPVPSPSDISMDSSISGDNDGNAGRETIARDIVDRNLSVLVQHCGHGAYWSFDAMRSGPDPAHEMKSCDKADGSVPTHAQKTHVIEEDDASSASWIDWLAQQRTYNNIRAAGLVDDR